MFVADPPPDGLDDGDLLRLEAVWTRQDSGDVWVVGSAGRILRRRRQP